MPSDRRPERIVGVIVAGGRATRMGGGDKALRVLAGRPIVSHVIERVRPQVHTLILNASGDPHRLAGFGLPVIPDTIAGHAGPLAGILAGLEWAAVNAPDCRWVASFPCDAPFLPVDMVARFAEVVRAEGTTLAGTASAGRTHPVVGLWPVALAPELREAMVAEGMRKIDVWTARYPLATVEFPTSPVDPFFNANRAEDLAEAERLLGRLAPTSQ